MRGRHHYQQSSKQWRPTLRLLGRGKSAASQERRCLYTIGAPRILSLRRGGLGARPESFEELPPVFSGTFALLTEGLSGKKRGRRLNTSSVQEPEGDLSYLCALWVLNQVCNNDKVSGGRVLSSRLQFRGGRQPSGRGELPPPGFTCSSERRGETVSYPPHPIVFQAK